MSDPSAPASDAPSGDAGPHRDAVRLILGRAAVFVGACRFVPVPLLDDYLADKARQHMVSSLLHAHGRDLRSAELKPIWGPSGGCISGCLMIPIKIIIWPIKKILKLIFLILTIREIALEASETLLLGRTVDRCIARGMFVAPKGPGEATRVRAAFDETFAASNNAILINAMSRALRGLTGLGAAGARHVRQLLRRTPEGADQPDLADGLPAAEQAAAKGVLDQVLGVLQDEKVQAFLAEFDASFDVRLARGPAEGTRSSS